MLATSGCVKLWQDSLDIKTYMIETAREGAAMKAPLADKLWIDVVSVLPPFNVRSLIVRKNDVEYETSYYTELLLSPANNVRNNLFTWFSDSGIFKEVSITGRSDMSHRLVVTVLRLHGSRMPEGNEAVMALKVSLLDERTEGVDVLMSRDYLHTEPIAEVNAEELIRAYNRALTQILVNCEADVVIALKTAENKDIR
jgi:ABC-type uncharacterized transport system auxiliary subunit